MHFRLLGFVACLAANLSATFAVEPVYPIKASRDGRYLVDARGEPFFYHADTAWQIIKRRSPEEIVTYLEDRKARGFNVIQIQAFSRELTPATSFDGLEPFEPIHDLLRPVEAYWKGVDSFVRAAEKRKLLVAMAPVWIRWGGTDQAGWRYEFSETNAAPFGRWLGERYAPYQNIVWILGGDANPIEDTHAVAELGRALHEKAPHQLITVHNKPTYSSRAFFEGEPWLGFNMAYTYEARERVHTHVLGEWARLGKPMPIVLGESGYEEESNDAAGGAPLRIRHQAYEAVLSGCLGGHAFGQKHIWRMDEQWRQRLDTPATQQMGHLKSLFTARKWHLLEPDLNQEVVESARDFVGKPGYVSSARARDGSFALAYLPTARAITVNLGKLAGPATAFWVDPTAGTTRKIEGSPFPASRQTFTPPSKNSAGESDWVLLLESARK